MVDWDPVKSPTPGHQGYTGLASKIGINTDDVMTLHDAYLGQDSQASTECTGDRDSRSHFAMKPSHGTGEEEKEPEDYLRAAEMVLVAIQKARELRES